MYSFSSKLRVRYYETDKMGVVHHSNYVRYYEYARTEMMIHFGFSYGTMEKEGVMMPVISASSKYLKPAYYEDELTICVIVKDLPTAKMHFFYEIFNQNGELINTGETILSFTNMVTNKPCRPPQRLMEMIKNVIN
ncbi:MAG: acyl-CoA thioesterase [Prevotellaceae bacterium]|jgi:acyl-CoA thioester hydrolase|nr:acyl-CoA thioesterase [Prevotellaceae bacterium]